MPAIESDPPDRARRVRRRLLRRLATVLIVVGGIILAYPFWSAVYAKVQQDRLDADLSRISVAFAPIAREETAALPQTVRPAVRLGAVAAAFERRVRRGQPVGRLIIPRIGVDRVVQQGSREQPALNGRQDQDLLRSGPVHYGMTPLPGAGRPFAVAGHRTTYGAPFNRINELRRGDEIVVVTPYARLQYRVVKHTVVSPGDVTVLRDRGYDLVLTTCHPPYSASSRYIVWAQLESFELR